MTGDEQAWFHIKTEQKEMDRGEDINVMRGYDAYQPWDQGHPLLRTGPNASIAGGFER